MARLDGNCRYKVPTFLKRKRRGRGSGLVDLFFEIFVILYWKLKNGTIVRWFEIICKILLTCQKLENEKMRRDIFFLADSFGIG